MRYTLRQAKEAQSVKDLHSTNSGVTTDSLKPRYTLKSTEEKTRIDNPFFKARTAKTRLEDSIRMEKPKQFFDCFVVEGEVTYTITYETVTDDYKETRDFKGFEL